VDLSRPQDFPLFAQARGARVEVGVGEMLYLPAGWFHEVESSGGLHMAFNYCEWVSGWWVWWGRWCLGVTLEQQVHPFMS
jgi:hypothetical protein